MKVKKKHTKNLEAIQGRISVLRFEISEREEELQELANHLADIELSLSVEVRTLKDEFGITANAWSI